MFTLLLGCSEAPSITASPASGSASGYYRVRFDLAASEVDAAAVTSVRVAGITAYDLTVSGDEVSVTVQGSPTPGAASVALETADGTTTFADAFAYDAPVEGPFARVAAVGASLTQGVQSGGMNEHSVLAGPAAVLARQAGAFFGLPIFVPEIFVPMAVADVGAPPDCVLPDMSTHTAQAGAEALGALVDADTYTFAFAHGRVDPELVPRNVAVASSDVHEVVDGPESTAASFLAHLVYDPYGSLDELPPLTQMDLVEAAEPTLILSADLIGNDLLDTVTDGESFDPSLATPEAEFSAKLEETVGRLAGTGAEVFLATLPSVVDLPLTAERRRLITSTGAATEAEMDTALAEIDRLNDDYNARLISAAAAYANVHVVDLAAEVDRLRAEPLVANGETLTVGKLGGLVSLDGVHFSDTGYAQVSNLFAAAIDDAVGSDLPRVDLDAVAASDPYVPSALRRAGLDPTACE